jgi:hypothetical protein
MWDICQGLAALAERLSELVSGLDQVLTTQTNHTYALHRIENSLNEVLNKTRSDKFRGMCKHGHLETHRAKVKRGEGNLWL